MTPLSLSAASPGSAAASSGQQPAGRADNGGGFDSLLQAAPPPAPRSTPESAAKPPAQPPAKSAAKPASGNDAKAADADASSANAASDGDAAADPASAEKPASAQTQETPAQDERKEIGDLPWPPPGLSALMPLAAAIAPPAPTTPPPLLAQAAADPATTAPPRTPPAAAPALPAATPAQAIVKHAAPATAQETALGALAQLAKLDSPQATAKSDSPAPATDSAATALFGPLLQPLTASASSDPATPFPAALSAPAALHAADFDEAIGARVGWLADQKIGHAHIRVTPHELGAVEVKLQLDGNRVHATFSSAHADVRQALETSLPKLRQMLDGQGLQLAHADVGHSQPDPRAAHGDNQPASNDSATDGPGLGPITATTLHRLGLLDAYA